MFDLNLGETDNIGDCERRLARDSSPVVDMFNNR